MIEKLIGGLIEGGPLAIICGLLILLVVAELRHIRRVLVDKFDRMEESVAWIAARQQVLLDRLGVSPTPLPQRPKDFKPVPIQGEPASETLKRDRR